MQTCANATTVAFAGLEARRVEVQVQMTGGTPGIVIVGLGDKAVSESRERVRGCFRFDWARHSGRTSGCKPRARGHAEGGDALRSADCAGDDGVDRRAAA